MALVNINTTQLETTAEDGHSVWGLEIVRQVMDGAYSNVYVRETALFTHHLTEGLKPAHGDYPQAQLKPELHQENKKRCKTVRSFIEGEDDPSEDTDLGKQLQQVLIHIFAKCDAYEGTYEDLYTAFSTPTS